MILVVLGVRMIFRGVISIISTWGISEYHLRGESRSMGLKISLRGYEGYKWGMGYVFVLGMEYVGGVYARFRV
jgi:hypothetical protein